MGEESTSWSDALRLVQGVLSIHMSNRGLSDARAERWATWLATAAVPLRAQVHSLGVADFSRNSLSAAGACAVLRALRYAFPGSRPRSFKVYANRLGASSSSDLRSLAAVELEPSFQLGFLKELHMSHNGLSVTEELGVLLAAILNKKSAGNNVLPWRPFWLRLEGNHFADKEVRELLKRPGVCAFNRQRCLPQTCGCRRATLLHLPHIATEARNCPPPPPKLCVEKHEVVRAALIDDLSAFPTLLESVQASPVPS
jgi:hypothetical protein